MTALLGNALAAGTLTAITVVLTRALAAERRGDPIPSTKEHHR